jgi:hypothetical protein
LRRATEPRLALMESNVLPHLRFGEFETPRGSNPRRPWEKHKRSRLAHVIG